MNKLSYNLKTIYDYIDGNDLDFDVDKLEDDVNFMMKVIILTNDKNMYNLCSNNVKSDFSFTKFMINKFNQDYKFIETVADNYLELNKKIDTLEEGNKIEIQALMHNILSKKENDYYSIYSLSLSSAYNVERISINSYLQDADDSIKEILGLGFIIISENYYNKENTLNYFAERMLEEIVYEQDESFENYVHKVFSNPKLIEKYGRNKFLLSYISTHDNCLANYVSCNMELIKFMQKYLDRIIKNWKIYEYNHYLTYEQKVTKFLLATEQIYKKYENKFDFTYTDFIVFFIKKYKLEKFFHKLNNFYIECINFSNYKYDQKNNKFYYDDVLVISENVITKEYVLFVREYLSCLKEIFNNKKFYSINKKLTNKNNLPKL